MEDCIFCKLANGQIPTDLVYEDDEVAAFKDVNPKAKIHYLFVPKEHISSMNECAQDGTIMAHIFQAIAKVAKRDGFDRNGYRIVSNCGKDGGQTVHHLHVHVLAGEPVRFPGFDEED